MTAPMARSPVLEQSMSIAAASVSGRRPFLHSRRREVLASCENVALVGTSINNKSVNEGREISDDDAIMPWELAAIC